MKKEHPFVVKLRCRILKNNPKEPFRSIVNTLALESNRQIKINFDGMTRDLIKIQLRDGTQYSCTGVVDFFAAGTGGISA